MRREEDAFEVGEAELLGPAVDPVRARVLREQLRRLAKGGAGDPVLQEMAAEVLAGRVGLREALRIPAYAEALGERVRAFRRTWAEMSPQERAEHEAEALRFAQAQRDAR
ncbi:MULTISPECIES: hypothetical protein [unclassified Streptomyces]|uniref:hypothetical protein n=1 Tax=unclassified Streptomyces TaxID=2593676 RepID=UPI0038269F5E